MLSFRICLLLTCVGWILLPATAVAMSDPFLLLTLDRENQNSACSVMDVDGDGSPDVVAGKYWYRFPDFKRHFVRDVELIRGRQDDYANLVVDVNADGLDDIVSVNYRSQSIYWVQHPDPAQGLDAEWSRTVMATPGPMETGRLEDVDGDGVVDILPNGTKFAAWWSLSPGPSPRWQRHALPDDLAGHGLGIGDINGDGRADLVGPSGWAEAPADRRRGRWVFHREFRLFPDASIPILVVDVDADGDSDLIWGRAHQVGLYWMEQGERDQNGARWQTHVIDTTNGQNHSLLWDDLDGNGVCELIAGSRYLGHGGRDIGEYNPLRMQSFEFDAARRVWKQRILSWNDRVSPGLDPKVADIDGDGDTDLVCADQNGLYILLNPEHESPLQRQAELAVNAELAAMSKADRSVSGNRDPMFVQRRGLQPVAEAFDCGARRDQTLQGMIQAMGPLPTAEKRCPLDLQIHDEQETELYRRLKISYAPEPGDRVPAWLLLPKQPQGPAPAMLCLHQTTRIGKDEPAGLGGLPGLHYAHELAELGFVCLVPDYPSFGDYQWDFGNPAASYQSGSMKAIWNNIRGIDLLQTLQEVHPDRIGCVGHSLGGHNTLFTAAFDQRIRAVVTSCGFTGFHDYYGGKLAGWTSDRYMPRIRDVYSNDPDQVPFDFPEVLAAIAPRAIFVSAPIHDSNFGNAGVRRVMEQVQPVYRTYAAADASLVAEYPDCGHEFPADVRARAWEWLKRRLP